MDEVDFSAQSYRMSRIESIQRELKLERQKRMVLIEKYNKGCVAIDVVQHGLVIGAIDRLWGNKSGSNYYSGWNTVSYSNGRWRGDGWNSFNSKP